MITFSKNTFRSMRSAEYTAVIVEPRKHKATEFVLNNFLENLSSDWNIVIFHGKSNKDFMYDIINKMQQSQIDRITTVQLEVDNLTIPVYNALFKSPLFYNYIPTEMFLVFQTDSIILPENKHMIYDFMDYDYVGAPIRKWTRGTYLVGNGGLSLRRKSKMLEVIEKGSADKYLTEDVFFVTNKYIDVNKPSYNEAKNFSTQSEFSNKSFGVHKTWKHANKQPLIKKLYELNRKT